ncbi:hypothetical protein M011DRAFT_420184 [Sporormia fimetaria CBS 119925]|uniref:SAGA-associated factor 11 n=1 Tax=Sporormia fimetaria CBS 119925 TaxID=1340428 RepID=A0A6A6VFE8_9PLEO|nr:hypothetical protein M011DRAFT_420184 [Sporormia fimetaria CBS 119925]
MPPQDNPKKRKPDAASTASTSKRARFPGRPQHTIRTMPTLTAYPNGELNVSRFMRAHENEIKSLEKAMKAAKKGMSRRAFQEVPRELRRRTGSHNPQRVPKRLRIQAFEEAKMDNTPTAKNKSGSGIGKGRVKWLRRQGIEKSRKGRKKRDKNEVTVTAEAGAKDGDAMEVDMAKGSGTQKTAKVKKRKLPKLAVPGMPASRFRRRQLNKTWLPTHIWHTKRATMTPPKEPLWRFAIPLAPATKTYRLTHRAATLRGAVAWDMSYMATIGLEGAEASLVGLLKGLHFAEEDVGRPWQDKGVGKKWRNGTRALDGWIFTREGNPPRRIALVTVIWSVPDHSETAKRKVFIRVHPSAFLQLWNEVIRIAKVQKPSVVVEDLRFEIGSIEMMGPAAAETLSSIFRPVNAKNTAAGSPESIWPTLAPITNSGLLPEGTLVAFSCSDPRLRDPPMTAQALQDTDEEALTETLADWPVDRTMTTPFIFDRKSRMAAGRTMPSQKSINRRKGAATPGEYPESRSTDPQIPMLIYVSRRTNTWTVLLPWKCVAPFWRGITRYPISTGGNPRFGGLDQIRQVSYEHSRPCFPFDFPGTNAGWIWELQQRVVRKHEWIKRPKGKRVEWNTLDFGTGKKGELGDPWACAWERLMPPRSDSEEQQADPEPGASPFQYMLASDVCALLDGHTTTQLPLSLPVLFTVKVSMVQRGVPRDCARVYRLPTNNAELREQWLALVPDSQHSGAARRQKRRAVTKDPSTEDRTRTLAASLLEPPRRRDGPPQAGDADYPRVPDEEDLVGFVTTGNYNLAEGRPTAIANLTLHRILQPRDGIDAGKRVHLCIVREAGQTLGRRPARTMSEDTAAGEKASDGGRQEAFSSDALADLTKDILEDVLYTITHRTVLASHRTEKLLRMQSAATQAESLALANLEPQSLKGAPGPQAAPNAETPAAKYDNGLVHLKGNPLKTTPEIVCPHCKLPRLMHPIRGKGMQHPDLSRQYCKLYPFVTEEGLDVYGNPFPTDMAKSKKERELIKQQQKSADKEGTPGSQDADAADNQGKEIKQLDTGGKPASYIPWHTCPSCKRSLLITRFAQHLEKCLGISGRQSSRNAMAKMQNGSGSGLGNTPLGSRMGTPAPGSQGDGIGKAKMKSGSPIKKLDDEDDEAETPEKKKKKKSSYIKKADRERLAKEPGSLKVKLKTGSFSKESFRDRDKPSASPEKPEKRERDDNDADGAPKAKKIKLSLGGKAEDTKVSAK